MINLEKLECGAKESLKINNLLKLSVAPNFSGKIFATDKVLKVKVELRKLPCIELYVALSCDYPSR